MKNHEVTADELADALDTEIVLAQAVNGPYKRSKDLKYNPMTETFYLRHFSGEKETKRTYLSSDEAAEAYNAAFV